MNKQIRILSIPLSISELLIKIGTDKYPPAIKDIRNIMEVFKELQDVNISIYTAKSTSFLELSGSQNPKEQDLSWEELINIKIPTDIENFLVFLIGSEDKPADADDLLAVQSQISSNNPDIRFIVSHHAVNISYV